MGFHSKGLAKETEKVMCINIVGKIGSSSIYTVYIRMCIPRPSTLWSMFIPNILIAIYLLRILSPLLHGACARRQGSWQANKFYRRMEASTSTSLRLADIFSVRQKQQQNNNYQLIEALLVDQKTFRTSKLVKRLWKRYEINPQLAMLIDNAYSILLAVI